MSDVILMFTLGCSVLVVGLLIIIAWRGLNRNADSDDDGNESSGVRRPRGRPAPRVAGGLRQRARPQRGHQGEEEEDEGDVNALNEEDFGDDFGDDGFAVEDTVKKIGVKKQRKLEMKAEKKLARERELQEREERKKKQEEYERMRKLEEEKLEAEEKAKEEAERLAKLERERIEHEQYLELVKSFQLDEEGFDGDDNEEESQNKLQAFIDYIKSQKVVHMDQLAGNFNMRTQDVVQRLQDLLQQELLVGVIDDRGKFIYITNEELQAVAKFMRQRGRVSITELAENSNTFINLNPVETQS